MSEHATNQSIEEKRPNTRFRDCPNCQESIEYWWTSGMSECFPHFYCDQCSNVIWRATDSEAVCTSKPTEALADKIAETLPPCECGGSFKPGANPKCPSCHYEFKHERSIPERLTDPCLILVQGARFISEN